MKYIQILSVSVFALSMSLVAAASDVLNPYLLPQPANAPDRLLAVIEIPQGSFIKYEIDVQTGQVFVDRFLSQPVQYPANYGSLPSIFAEDGDPVDVLVLTRVPVAPGVLIDVRPIGLLRMLDDGEQDDKVIAVPADDVDPFYREVRDISDLSSSKRAEIEEFFRIYKSPSNEDQEVQTGGFGNAQDAMNQLRQVLVTPD